MNVFELAALLTLNKASYDQGLKEAESQGQSTASTIGSTLSGIGTTIATSLAAAATAVSGLTVSAVNSYADYEQLVGGVEKLFGEDAQTVIDNASNAFKTAQISANEYMETVTSFSASLIQSLSGDTEAAVEYADMALSDMADNANTFGTSMESIQNAYQGFAKGNYTMLDNLKLGYGGTATEMERLITDAEALDDSFTATRDSNGDLTMSFSDIVKAINLVQTNLKITGTTSKEASKTISGSINSMKAAWQNFVTGLGDDSADIGLLVDNLTESLTNVVDNIGPTVETILENITEAIPSLVESLGDLVESVVPNLLPKLISAASSLVSQLASSLPDLARSLLSTLPDVIVSVFESGGLLESIAQGIGNILINLPSLLIDTISGIAEGISTLLGQETEDNINDDLFSGTQERVVNSWSAMIQDAASNMREAWAGLIGNTDWQTAEAELQVTFTMIDDFAEKYADWKQTIDDTNIEFEAKSATFTAQVSTLFSLTDDNGFITDDKAAAAQKIIDSINSYLPTEDQISLTPINTSETVNVVADMHAEGFNNAEIKQYLIDNYPSLDPNNTANAVPIDAYVQMNIAANAAGLTDYSDITAFIIAHAEEYGLTDAQATALCDLILSPTGEVIAPWLSTEGGTLESYIREQLGLSDTDEADAQLEAEIQFVIDETENGTSVDDIITKLEENFGAAAAEKWTAEVVYSITNAEGSMTMEELIEQGNEYLEQQRLMALMDVDLSFITESYKSLRDAQEQSKDAQKDWAEAMANGNYDAAKTEMEDMLASYELEQAAITASKEAYTDYYTHLGEQMGLAGSELDEYVQKSLDSTAELTSMEFEHTNSIDNMLAKMKEMSEQGIDVTSYALQLAELGASYDTVTSAMGLTSEQSQLFAETLANTANAADLNAESWYSIISSSPELMDAFTKLGLNAADASYILEALAECEEGVGDSASEMQTDVEEAASGTSEAISGTGDSVQTEVEEINDALDSVDGSGTVEEIAATNEEAVAEMDTMVTGLPEKSNNALTSMYNQFTYWEPTLTAEMDTITNNILDKVKLLATRMTTWGQTVGMNLNSGIRSQEQAAYSAGYSVALQAKRGAAGPDFYTSGYNAILGFINGMDSLYYSAYSKAYSIGLAAKRAVNAALDISSPSKALRESGHFTVEGFVLGIEDELSAVEEMSTQMAEAAIIDEESSINYTEVDAQAPKWATDLSNQIANISIYLDGDTLVGQTINRIDSSLEDLNYRTERNAVVFGW